MPKHWLKDKINESHVIFNNINQYDSLVKSIEITKEHGPFRKTFNIRVMLNNPEEHLDANALLGQLIRFRFNQYVKSFFSSGDICSSDIERVVQFLVIIRAYTTIASKEFYAILDEIGVWKEDFDEMLSSKTVRPIESPIMAVAQTFKMPIGEPFLSEDKTGLTATAHS